MHRQVYEILVAWRGVAWRVVVVVVVVVVVDAVVVVDVVVVPPCTYSGDRGHQSQG